MGGPAYPCLLYLVWSQHFCVISRAKRGQEHGALPAEYQFPGSLGVGEGEGLGRWQELMTWLGAGVISDWLRGIPEPRS